ncbi:Inositol 2-dehydrogenase/D-chiro-inositol 3-dehydrogenase [Paenibacillus solanacearum]|uniref:Inositol 2-dehydrogenase/D-chiro-inositol 3-dehydrogenase n=1 Tax=Paenibacillus solanacearum TaxID=2048548 RepID=A0A916K3J6_9BACL|nr:Gfo/Idh/MocA family oxidoreductase [Paenibacillus solanacearum]CAG7637126.1 Inositol 2-dehydrogenase/D-chiro-inositol 3-dehydrogenase [Paenibacillus solanacearum]
MIRVAVIGSGAISSAHIEAYLTFKGRCQIVAVCDFYVEKAEKCKQKYQLDCAVYHDYHELLGQDDIDLISVCTPPYTHAEIAVNALKSGKHVVVEKPMASSLEECDRMNDAAHKSGKILSVISQNRFGDAIMKLKRVLDSGLAGTIVHAQVDSHWWRGYEYYDLWWRGTWEKEGGGCTLNHAVHHIDMFQWLMGMPEQVTAVMRNTSHDNAEVEDLSIAILTYSRALAQITSSVVHHGQEQQLIFQGEKARISMPWRVTASTSRENGFPQDNSELKEEINLLAEQVPPLPYTGHKGQLDDVLTAIENGTGKVLVTGQEGRKTLELITAIYQSASTRTTVTLPLQPNSPFYTSSGMMANAPRFYEKKRTIVGFDTNEIIVSGETS